MKVAYFIGSLNRGGTEMLTLDICRKKDYAPFEMILVYRNDGELTEDFKATRVPTYRMKPKGLKIGYFGQLRKMLKQEKVDIVHAQTLTDGVIAVLVTVFTNIKVVVSFHGFYRSALMVLFRHFIMWNAEAMIFVSQFVRDWYVNHSLGCPNGHCNVVYNGINFDKFQMQYEEPEFFRDNRLRKPGNLRFVMVGNFVSGRSQIVVCKSLKILKDRGIQNVDFYFVGKRVDNEANLYDDCEKYCTDNDMLDFVHFVGSRGDIPAILKYVDGFVYSTNHDTFGIAVIEALASGLPVLVNDWPVMKEVSGSESLAVRYFLSDNVQDCANKMVALINQIKDNPEDVKSDCLMMAQKMRQTYSIENHINNLMKIYQCIGQ